MALNIPDNPSYKENDIDEKIVKENKLFGLNFGAYKPNLEVENMSLLIEMTKDLTLLLKLPYNIYISHMLYDEDLKYLLASLLQFQNRWYQEQVLYPSEKSKLYHIVFLVYYRLLMDTEGIRSIYQVNSHFGGRLNGLCSLVDQIIDIPTIFDIIAIYIKNNMYIII